MLLSFHFITNIFETSTPVCRLVIRWHCIEFGVFFPHFWSCEGATSLSSALHGWDKVAQHTEELIDGNLKTELWLENWLLVELRGKKTQESGRDHRVPIKGSLKSSAHADAYPQRCEEGRRKCTLWTVRVFWAAPLVCNSSMEITPASTPDSSISLRAL